MHYEKHVNKNIDRFYQSFHNQPDEEFIKDTTQFDSMEELRESIAVFCDLNELPPEGLATKELDEFISDTTEYSCWSDFLNACHKNSVRLVQ
ncbi:hypothetical protein [Halobacillus litoralis]|uniref:CdiI immunity protein domain-containing protein n=1 Tax=Halobacillus litoralis TaxID=45668 RepID=A0A410M9V3_9BACI|nr:hypothetical protein [Halobacillus litoralis]QAS51450.1 hypothetical protein HLI_04050 [Halobacillus litoralis]